MRLLKENRREYLPFLSSVEQLERASNGKYKLKVRTNLPLSREQVSVLSGGNVNIDLLAFSEKINSLSKTDQILEAFKSEVNRLSFFTEVEIFTLYDKTSECKPIDKLCNQKLYYYVKNFLKNGVLDWIAETNNPKFLPWDVDNTASKSGLSCLVIPIFSNKKFSGVLAALTNLKYLSADSFEYRTLVTILNFTFAKLEFLKLREELNKTYSDYQILQSKLFNDFKFAAIGELTSKSIEEIGSPLQVIMSYSDLLQKENPELDTEATEFIRSQVHTIKEILDRLGNFINNSDSKPKLYSCSINTAVNDFYKVIEHSLNADSCECVLDLEENIPSILSNYNSLKQILINAFSLINPLRGTGGGIIIQSRYSNETIIVKMLFTDTIESLSKDDKEFGLNILKHLMDKHEGEMRISTESGAGTSLIFSFPLKRKNERIAMLSGLLIIKIAAIVIVLFTLSFLFYKRSNSKKKQSAQFRHNIGLLREEKLLMYTDKKIEKKRQKLLKIKISDEDNHKKLLNKSKKLGVSAGEIILAAKIQMSSK